MDADEFFTEWKRSNKDKFGDYGDYNSDEYAIAFAEAFIKHKVESVTDEMIEKKGFEFYDTIEDKRIFCRGARFSKQQIIYLNESEVKEKPVSPSNRITSSNNPKTTTK